MSVTQSGGFPAVIIGGLTITLIDVLYLGLFGFFIYQAFKNRKMERDLKDPKFVYEGSVKPTSFAIIGMIVAFGIVTIYTQKQILTGLLMMLLGVGFYFSSRNKLIVSAEGLYADHQFLRWDEVRKWAWDIKGHSLVLISKSPGKEQVRRVLRVGSVNMAEVNDKIRFFKLGKGEGGEMPTLEYPEDRDKKASKSKEESKKNTEDAPQAHKTGLKGTGKHTKKRKK